MTPRSTLLRIKQTPLDQSQSMHEPLNKSHDFNADFCDHTDLCHEFMSIILNSEFIMFFLTQINPGDPLDCLTHNDIDFNGERNVHLKWGGAWKQNVSAVKTLLSL